jgi:hypothetical protein
VRDTAASRSRGPRHPHQKIALTGWPLASSLRRGPLHVFTWSREGPKWRVSERHARCRCSQAPSTSSVWVRGELGPPLVHHVCFLPPFSMVITSQVCSLRKRKVLRVSSNATVLITWYSSIILRRGLQITRARALWSSDSLETMSWRDYKSQVLPRYFIPTRERTMHFPLPRRWGQAGRRGRRAGEKGPTAQKAPMCEWEGWWWGQWDTYIEVARPQGGRERASER